MYTHAPKDYECPICLAVQGIENDITWIVQNDIFYRDDLVMGFIGSKFIKGNEGHPILVLLQHYENIYELPAKYGHAIFDLTQKVSRALKEIRQCDGLTIFQNNEPAGNQHAWHYHVHVVPRFENDNFH